MKKRIFSVALSLCMAFSLLPGTALATDGDGGTEQVTINVTSSQTNYTVGQPAKLVVSGAVTLTGSGDAFTINADTTLEFAEGASLTLTGYTNGFVVEDATVTSGDMTITASSQMDVFRLQDGGGLYLSGDNSIQGSGKAGTAPLCWRAAEPSTRLSPWPPIPLWPPIISTVRWKLAARRTIPSAAQV